MKKTYSTWLPCFPGFYESWLYNNDMEESCANTMIDCLCDPSITRFPAPLLHHFFMHHSLGEDFDLRADFPAFRTAAAKAFCAKIADRLTELDCFDRYVSIEFEEIKSPKFYNFETDSVNCRIAFDAEQSVTYCREHLPEFRQYLLDNYEEHSGFFPFYSTDPADWLDPEQWTAHQPGAILDFILRNEDPEVDFHVSEQVLEDVHYMDYFRMPPALDRYLESPEAEALGKEYFRLMKQGRDYLEAMGNKPRYRKMVREAEGKLLDDLLEDMEADLKIA